MSESLRAERERANEAARLSAAARDEADDLRRQMADLREQVAILEESRTDRDAWAIRLCTEFEMYGQPFDVEDEYGAIEAQLRAYRDGIAQQYEEGKRFERLRDAKFAEMAADVAAAEQRGYERAIEVLRDADRMYEWAESHHFYLSSNWAEIFANYLESLPSPAVASSLVKGDSDGDRND